MLTKEDPRIIQQVEAGVQPWLHIFDRAKTPLD